MKILALACLALATLAVASRSVKMIKRLGFSDFERRLNDHEAATASLDSADNSSLISLDRKPGH